MVTIKVINWAKYKYNMNVEWIANVGLFYRQLFQLIIYWEQLLALKKKKLISSVIKQSFWQNVFATTVIVYLVITTQQKKDMKDWNGMAMMTV